MITTNVIQRTFRIRYKNSTGTAFAIDRENRQYLVTAWHVVEGITSGEEIGVSHDKNWKMMLVDVVGIGADELDVAVLACPFRLAPPLPLAAESAGLTYGQMVYFLGFPFGWDSGHENINRDAPIPFVKAGIVSALISGDAARFFIDAHGNRGFSGGPLVFARSGGPPNEFQVAAVVASAPTPLIEPVVDKSGKPLLDNTGEPIAYFRENQGFVVAYDIRHVTKLIEANPVGFLLPDENGN